MRIFVKIFNIYPTIVRIESENSLMGINLWLYILIVNKW